MRVVFPSDPLDKRSVDESFALERDAATHAGFASSLIDSEALDAGDFARAVQRLPERADRETVIYRGWMLTVASYAQLYDALRARGYALINDAAEYQHAHHLPESYPILSGATPRAVWTTTGRDFDLPATMQLLEPFGASPVVVKDYVKSQKHHLHEACFIPRANDPVAVAAVVSRFVELQGDTLAGGLVFREFLELAPLAIHSKSGMPLTVEYRVFFLQGRVLCRAEYWEEGDYAGESLPENLFAGIARNVRSNFFTMDVARRATGEWIIMEVGDGQVSALPERLDPEAFYGALAASGVA